MWTVHSSQVGTVLFGQAGHSQWDLILPVGALIGVVALGIWAIYQMKRWREETAAAAPLTPEQQLEHYQKMVDDGLLDLQDLARIKAQLERKTSEPPPDTSPSSKQPPNTSFREP